VKRLTTVFLAMLLPFLFVPRAFAGKPTIVKTPVDEIIDDDVDCAFPVEIHIAGTDLSITWTDSNGTVRMFEGFSGGYADLTDLDSGATLRVAISGPAHVTYFQDGSFELVGTGSWISFLEDPPGITQPIGRFVFFVDSEGNSTYQAVGRQVDLCAKLG
jgi:hypothetical protein